MSVSCGGVLTLLCGSYVGSSFLPAMGEREDVCLSALALQVSDGQM